MNLIILAGVLLITGCTAGGGSGLDTTFGTTGLVSVDFGADDRAHAIVINADSSFYVAGYTTASSQDFAIAKLTSAGVLDTTFSEDGMLTIDFSGADDEAYALGLQSDAKLIVAGRSGTGASAKLAVARVNTDGTLDTTYGTSGKLLQPIGTNDDFRALVISLDRAVIAGSSTVGGRTKFVVVRVTSAGALDSTFGSSGVVTETPGSVADNAVALAISSTRLYVAGTKQVVGSSDFAVLALTIDGALDTSFGTLGVATFDFTSLVTGSPTTDTALGFAVDTSSRPIVVGYVSGTHQQLAVARFTTAGVADTTFGTQGGVVKEIAFTSGSTTTIMEANLNTILPASSSYYLGGSIGTGVTSSAAGMLMGSAGTFDTFFGGSGVAYINVASKDESDACLIQLDGKLVFAGSSYASGSWNFLAARYRP